MAVIFEGANHLYICHFTTDLVSALGQTESSKQVFCMKCSVSYLQSFTK